MTGFGLDHNSLRVDLDHSRRSPVLAARGMVATSQPLAARAGLAMLEAGGSAVDAAIAAAAALTVVEPTSNGLGSDAFALIWDGSALHGLNGSGRWPAAADVEQLRSMRRQDKPHRGWPSVTVPGAVDSWAAMHNRFGRLPLAQILEPAHDYARRGHPVAPVIAGHWAGAAIHHIALALPGTETWADVFAPSGRWPNAGESWSSPAMAACFTELAESGLRSFYEGRIADALVEYSETTGGWLQGDDLANHHSEWVEPISVSYRGVEVWELPPNGQGIAALMALGILERLPAPGHSRFDPSTWHHQIEAMKSSFADSDRHVADPEHAPDRVAELLAPARLDARAAAIDHLASDPGPGDLGGGGTVYLATADADGMMVSFIQSNYEGFGSGVVEPTFGISLQNRGAGFDLDPASPNVAAPGKRPRHTIIPGFLSLDDAPLGPFGVMGGEMQPQGHLQVVSNIVDHGLHPQAALDAPRWRVERDWSVKVERAAPAAIADDLRIRGHEVVVSKAPSDFGRGQIILRRSDGAYVGGSEPRADGQAVGF